MNRIEHGGSRGGAVTRTWRWTEMVISSGPEEFVVAGYLRNSHYKWAYL
jgi:hypothetical protein